ncbi:MAG: transglutaminase-like domain-containing protein [Acidobacteriota bacterium]
MAWLAQRELGGRRVSLTGPGVAESSSVWLAIRVADGPRVGHVHLRQDPEDRHGIEGVLATTETTLSLQLMGKATDLRLGGTMWRALGEVPAGTPRVELDFAVDSLGQAVRVDGAIVGDRLAATVESAGETFPLDLPMDPNLLVDTGFGTASRFPVPAVGETLRVDSFDPLTMGRGTARIRGVGDEMLDVDGPGGMPAVATRVLEVKAAGFDARAWVEPDDGEVVRAETSFGLVLERMATPGVDEVAAADVAADAAGDLLALSAIRPLGDRPSRGASRLVVRVGGFDADDAIELPADERQRPVTEQGPAVWQIEAAQAPDGVDRATAPSPAWLAADPFVQSDHPRMVEAARAILAEAGDPEDRWQQAQAIYEWVYTRLDKVPVVGLPSALEVLESRQGDCNEHTVLYIALARAIGLPTRIAIGVVWSDELDGFYYHAWPEPWIDGRFVAMDPTLGQPLADATHLALLHGGIESWPRLLPYLGRLEIETLEIDRTEIDMPESEKDAAR